MSEESDELRGISGPDVAPPDSADELTDREIRAIRKKPDRPSPGDRHAESVDRHIADISNDRERLRSSTEALQAELNALRPGFAALEANDRASLAINAFSTAMVGLGGALMSVAGYGGDSARVVILWFGIATFLWGFLLQISSTWLAVAFRGPRPVQFERANSESTRAAPSSVAG